MDGNKILAIESSCDDMAAAVIYGSEIQSSVISSQMEHVEYGGVVPEIASRAHQRTVVDVVDQALSTAGCNSDELDAIAVTKGPGLAGSLLVGVCFAKAFALGRGIPLIGVNHLEGHIFSVFLGAEEPEFPFLCLIVSGGHTELLEVQAHGTYRKLGTTLDDAAGEAFDKIGSLLGLEYPAGPEVDRRARRGNPHFHAFPRSAGPDYDFSFSGLKTSVLYYLNKHKGQERDAFIAENLSDLCASCQEAIVDSLMQKLILAVEDTGLKRVAVVGGVSANSRLREKVQSYLDKIGGKVYLSPKKYCTDNAAMIAAAAAVRFEAGAFSELDLRADPNSML